MQKLKEFDLRVLRAAWELGENAYGMTIWRKVGGSLGAIYQAIDRLESGYMIKTRLGGATSERGGRPKLFVKVEATGLRALGIAPKHS